MDWYLLVIQRYVEFTGRSRRQEYWMFVLFNLIIAIVLSVIENAIGLKGFFSTIYSLAVLLPSLGVSVRRLHDTNRSGWWLLIALIPLVGAIVLLVFMVQDSQPGANEYGANPKEGATA